MLACTTKKRAPPDTFLRNNATYHVAQNEPSLFEKYANLLPFRQI